MYTTAPLNTYTHILFITQQIFKHLNRFGFKYSKFVESELENQAVESPNVNSYLK